MLSFLLFIDHRKGLAKIFFRNDPDSQSDKDDLNAEILQEKLCLIVFYLSHSMCARSGVSFSRWQAPYWLWDSRTLACRASQVFLASPSNMAVLGL